MTLASLINELLYEHECVVIPGFGALISNYKPARLDLVSEEIFPPSKSISFNSRISANDGLLINYLSSKTGMGYKRASDFIENEVSNIQNSIEKGLTVMFSGIGSFQCDVEGNIQFKPFADNNFLIESYGLPSLKAAPIAVQKSRRKIDAAESGNKEKRSFLLGYVAAAAIVGVIVTMSLWYLFNPSINSLTNEHNADVMSGILYGDTPAAKQDNTESAGMLEEVIDSEVSQGYSETIEDAPSEEQHDLIIKEVKSQGEIVRSSAIYFIIIGAFEETSNVEKAKQLLSARIPLEELFIEEGARLTKVGYIAGDDYTQAMVSLSEARSLNPDAWLYKRR